MKYLLSMQIVKSYVYVKEWNDSMSSPLSGKYENNLKTYSPRNIHKNCMINKKKQISTMQASLSIVHSKDMIACLIKSADPYPMLDPQANNLFPSLSLFLSDPEDHLCCSIPSRGGVTLLL